MPPTLTDHDRRNAQESQELVLKTISAHAASLLSLARRYSYCADDAQDAYQRGLEIFLRRAPTLQPEATAGWLHTVVKNEALAVKRDRQRVIGSGAYDPDLEPARHLEDADERVAAFQELEQAAEALGRLKPQELRALVLKARGYSYAEIGEITGWTYTKVNRCLTEGRRAFMDRYDAIAAGEECGRFESVLSEVADGEADAREVVSLRAHLRHCGACRVRLRECRRAPGGVAALLPAPVVAIAGSESGGWRQGLAARVYEAIAGGLHERVLLSAQTVQSGVEAAATGKVAIVAASVAAVAGGGAVVAGPLGDDDARRHAPRSVVHVRPLASTGVRPAQRSRLVTRTVAAVARPGRLASARRRSGSRHPVAHRRRKATPGAGEFEPGGAVPLESSPVASATTTGASSPRPHRSTPVATARAAPAPAGAAEFSP